MYPAKHQQEASSASTESKFHVRRAPSYCRPIGSELIGEKGERKILYRYICIVSSGRAWWIWGDVLESCRQLRQSVVATTKVRVVGLFPHDWRRSSAKKVVQGVPSYQRPFNTQKTKRNNRPTAGIAIYILFYHSYLPIIPSLLQYSTNFYAHKRRCFFVILKNLLKIEFFISFVEWGIYN